MSWNPGSYFYRMLTDKRGAAALVGALAGIILLGFAAVSVDAARAYVVWNQLQASSQAAALAAAKDIGTGGTPLTTAALYSSVTASDKNYIRGVTTTMVSGYPKLLCFSHAAASGLACTTNQTPNTSVNGVQVIQTATIPLYFAGILGFHSINLTSGATALMAGQALPPLNVMFIVDATASMGSNDAVCGATRLGCAIGGFEALLADLWPCTYASNNPGASCGAVANHNVANPYDEAALLQFPGVGVAPTGAACGSLATVAYAGVTGKTSKTTTTTTLTFAATPAFNTGNNTGNVALVTDMTNPSYIQVNTYIKSKTTTTALMSTTPTAGDTIGSGDSIAVWPPVYQIIPLSSDYKTSDAATTLNAASDLVGCLQTLKSPGGFATFYADAIIVAQQQLTANARSGVRNVIILLSDGEANATSASGKVNMVSQGPNWLTTTASNECKAAVTAAQAAAGAGTWVTRFPMAPRRPEVALRTQDLTPTPATS